MRIAISDASTPIPQKMAIGNSGWLSDCSDEAAADGAGICTEMRAAFGMSVLQSVFGKIPAHGDVATFGAEVQCASDEFKNSSGGVRNRTAQLRYDFSSNRADRISWRCGHRVKSRPATGRGRRVLPDRVAPDGNSVALRKTALAARPKVIVGFHLRHFEQTDEHVEPVGSRHPREVDEVFRDKGRGLVRPAIPRWLIGRRTRTGPKMRAYTDPPFLPKGRARHRDFYNIFSPGVQL
jgi:hypothetical protein